MVRRLTPSQYNAMVRQAQQQHAQEVRRYDAEVDRVNRANKQIVDKYAKLNAIRARVEGGIMFLATITI